MNCSVAGLVAAASLLASCGGSSPTYSRSAFVSCLQRHGAHKLSIPSQFVAIVHKLVVGSAKLAFVQFPGGEEDVFAFASDTAAARKVQGKFKGSKKVQSEGNLVVFRLIHPTAGGQKIVSACEESGRRT